MNRFSFLVYKILIALSALSGIYFLGLVLQWNGLVSVLFAILGLLVPFVVPAFKDKASLPEEPLSKPVVFTFGVSLFLLSLAAFLLSWKWGTWDASLIWNLAARALADPQNWKSLFLYRTISHTDYPLFLPALNALFLRFLPPASIHIVPVFFAAFATVLVPLWIFIRLAPAHIGVGIGALLLFLSSAFYINIGMTQGADVWLSLWILAAFFALEDARKSGRSLLFAFSGFFIGMSACTKNEGILAALCFFLVLLTYLPAKKKLLLVCAGALLPLAFLIPFKMFLAPAGDIFQSQKQTFLQMLVSKERYRLIWEAFQTEMTSYFFLLMVGLLFYAFHCLLKARWPHRHFLFIVAMLAGYGGIFLITPLHLPWHLLATNRLLLQLFPLIVYTLGKEAISISPISSVAGK